MALPLARSHHLPLGRAAVVLVVMLAVAAGLLPLVVPGSLFGRDAGPFAAGVIVGGSLVAPAVGRVRGLAIARYGRTISAGSTVPRTGVAYRGERGRIVYR